MPEVSFYSYIAIAIILLIGWVLYYISKGKKRRRPYYLKSERNWKEAARENQEEKRFAVFLIGDAGAPTLTKQEPNLKLLESELIKAGKDSVVFFLGDNIYPYGMPEATSPLYEIAEKRLLEQLHILKNFQGKV